MATWTCATCGPVPAGAIRHLDHNSPHGHEQHECGSSAGLDWTKTKEHDMSTEPTLTTQPDSPWLAGSIYHAWSAEDCIPDVNQLYADLEHAKASTIELFLDSEVGSEDDPEVHAERAKVAARLGWTQKHGNWDLVYTDKPGMAGWTDVYIGERHVLAKPTTAS